MKLRRVHLDNLLNSGHDIDALRPIGSWVNSKAEAPLGNVVGEGSEKVHWVGVRVGEEGVQI